MIKQLMSASLMILLAVGLTKAENLKIMSWNIANLSAENGVSLRHGSHKRTSEGIDIISDILKKEDSDIIALQEIGSISAARRVLGDDYIIIMEARCGENCEVDQGEACCMDQTSGKISPFPPVHVTRSKCALPSAVMRFNVFTATRVSVI